jgi:hypothetical protein
MRSDPDLDALVRRAEEAGGKVLRTVLPEGGPFGLIPIADLPTETGWFPVAEIVSEFDPNAIPARKKPSKYRNVRTMYDGVRYDSRAEADYAARLDVEVRATPGMFWIRQPKFRLGCRENVYVADFLVYRGPSSPSPIEVADVKGHRTAKFARDVRLWKSYGPCPLAIVTRAGKGWQSEVIRGGRQ